jgi:hypothetical protein
MTGDLRYQIIVLGLLLIIDLFEKPPESTLVASTPTKCIDSLTSDRIIPTATHRLVIAF